MSTALVLPYSSAIHMPWPILNLKSILNRGDTIWHGSILSLKSGERSNNSSVNFLWISTVKSISILINLPSLSVCLCHYAFGRASTYGAETWHGGRVWRAGWNRQLFVATRQVKGHLEVKSSRNALWLPNLVSRTPDQSVVHCWGQRSWRGHLGSARGQIA